LDIPGTLLGASSTGCAQPNILAFNIRHSERRLSDNLAHAEISDTIPWTNHIAQPALKASFEGISTAGFDDINNFLVVGYILHDLISSLSLT
jgi:hypothetical protein